MFWFCWVEGLSEVIFPRIFDSGPTFHEGASDSWLDVLIVDDLDHVTFFEKSAVPFIDFHDSFLFNYTMHAPKLEPQKFIFRNFKHCNYKQLKSDVKLIVQNHLNYINDESVDRVLDGFNADIL